jgi:hypothetical protein
LNLKQRFTFAALKDLYLEAIAAQSLRYDPKQAAIVR